MSRITSSAYQYLQQSKLPTNKFQRSLPRLKIPNLEKTCQRYAASLEPVFARDPHYSKTLESLKLFQNGPAKELHRALIDYDKTVKHSSYINEFWFNMYLSSRMPLPLNFNPFLVWRDESNASLRDQSIRSTNFIISAMRFKKSLEHNVLEPEVFHLNPAKVSPNYANVLSYTPEGIATYVSFLFKAFPLDMSQYKNLFNSTRVPKVGKDEIMKYDATENRHVLVIKNGQFYVFNVIDEDGNLRSPEDIYSNIRYIAEQPSVSNDHLTIGELTTADRDFWAGEREHLINLSDRNKEHLKLLDSAILALCLDDHVYESTEKIRAAHDFLHGSNSKNPINRWFDKSISIIMSRDGHAAINFEHSWGDGVAVLRFFNDVFNDSSKNPQIKEAIHTSQSDVRKLDFDLDERLRGSISRSRDFHIKVTDNLEIGAVETEKLNRDYFKKNKLSPDSMIQLAFQLAFKKVYKHTPVTYESCSTAAFKGGRTETVRPCTNETNNATQAIIEKNMSLAEIKQLLLKASKCHFRLCKEASMGDGFDRHLFALKEMAMRSGSKLPDFFQDPLYLDNQKYVLSTSTLYGECFAGGGFAPVVPNGFGLGYGYVDKSFGVLVSSNKDQRNNTEFVQALDESLDDIRKICES